MEKSVQAVHKDGVLLPLESVPLKERQQVTLTISDPAGAGHALARYFTPEEWAEAVHDDITLDEVRRALSTISGPLSEALTASHQER
jgi:predicted DNA-binding antitoxin AbrB/MazE fold protein